jgi:hypothetical protein
MSEQLNKTDKIMLKSVEKSRPVLIHFKTMQEIFDTVQDAHYDGHGNLCAYNYFTRMVEKLTPSHFHLLGLRKECHSHHSYPGWAIKKEWGDIFEMNMALRYIASGKLDLEQAIDLAKRTTLPRTELYNEATGETTDVKNA